MSSEDFNIKYKNYIEEGHYGLSFSIPKVTEYLDLVFQGLILKEGFKYSQIKLKFNNARFYANSPDILNTEIEQNINKLVEQYDKENKATI